MIDLTEYQSLYMEELDEQLQLMEEEILRFEKHGESLEGIKRLFRAAHTLKGSSAAMGYEKMKQLTHNMEHILEEIRTGQAALTAEVATLFFQCLDRMKILRSEIASSNEEVSSIDDLVAELHRKEGKTSSRLQLHQVIELSKLSKQELQAINAQIINDELPQWICIRLQDQCEMRAARFQIIEMLLGEFANILWSEPNLTDKEDRNAFSSWLIASSKSRDEMNEIILSWMDVEHVDFKDFDSAMFSETLNPTANTYEENTDHSVSASANLLPEKSRVQSVRVNVDRLEQLMNLVGELVIDQTRIKQIEKQLINKFGMDDTLQDLGQLSDHFSQIVGELQESVMKVRMLPIEQLFNRFPRMIRDLSQTLGKDIELVLEGKDTELDRTLIEEIGDPLIHLIRNAVDHGIELPAERRQKGKPDKGSLIIRASHEDNQILIVVEDDGAGIDTQRLLQKAVNQNLLSAAEAEHYPENDALNLIFHPGLSTANQLSDISGRGVGMDIVRAGIEKMNGRIDIESTIGEGTRIKIRLPLTLAIITGLMVRVSDNTFIIPMSNVAEIVRVDPNEISFIRGVPIVTIREQVIPLVWLHDCFGYPRQMQINKHIPVVIIARAEKRYAIAVDDLLGIQEVVIKSIGSFIGHVELVAGATILGNGKVALIIEIGGLIKRISRS